MSTSMDSTQQPMHIATEEPNSYRETDDYPSSPDSRDFSRSGGNDPVWGECDDWANYHLLPSPIDTKLGQVLQHCVTNSSKAGFPDIAVSAAQGRMLQIQAKLINAKHILEVGTLGGYSAIWMANAGPDVHVTSVEIDEKCVKLSRENLEYAGLTDRAEIIHNNGLDGLAQLQKEVKSGQRPKFRMVFIDADKVNNLNYFNMAKEMCEKGSCIIVDNVGRRGRLANFEIAKQDDGVKGARDVVAGVGKSKNAGVTATLVQTVGAKSYDGFMIAIVE
ncbi:MAG: hypothetical protein M1828_005027 [Chrysothrix sp. TS-e1954]|nr:MAG: hypothetical protein M1828_005027 [Chrysothrix sp. TS-e1954]